MQRELSALLKQKTRLAALGLAVSKINHDLRNLLSSAQLFSDRLLSSQDQQVQRFAPKLMRALERAISFCESTLSYGRAQEPPPDRRPVALEPLVQEVRESLELAPDTPIRLISAVERGLTVDADPDQLFRILLNLTRNAVQALESRDARDPGRDQIRITGRREGAVVEIEVADTGPGIPETARAHLFEPFKSSPAPAAQGSVSSSPPNWCAPMTATSAWSRAPSARPSASPFPTGRSSCGRAAASASGPKRGRQSRLLLQRNSNLSPSS